MTDRKQPDASFGGQSQRRYHTTISATHTRCRRRPAQPTCHHASGTRCYRLHRQTRSCSSYAVLACPRRTRDQSRSSHCPKSLLAALAYPHQACSPRQHPDRRIGTSGISVSDSTIEDADSHRLRWRPTSGTPVSLVLAHAGKATLATGVPEGNRQRPASRSGSTALRAGDLSSIMMA